MMAFRAQALALLAAAANAQPSQNVDEGAINLQIAIPDGLFNADCQRPLASDSEPPTADCAPKNAFGSPSRAWQPPGSRVAGPYRRAARAEAACRSRALGRRAAQTYLLASGKRRRESELTHRDLGSSAKFLVPRTTMPAFMGSLRSTPRHPVRAAVGQTANWARRAAARRCSPRCRTPAGPFAKIVN